MGHNRSVAEIVDCAIAEDAQGIAITSYQGGHVEYFKYMYDLPRKGEQTLRSSVAGVERFSPARLMSFMIMVFVASTLQMMVDRWAYKG